MKKIYLDILDDDRKHVFESLGNLTQLPLGGGTALALQIGHRQSYDFDLFSSQPIGSAWYQKLAKIFGHQPTKRIDSTDQLTVELRNNIQITILHYWYRPLYPLITTNSLSLFDMRDIATDKAFTVGRRNVWRDYVDFYFLLSQSGITIQSIITDAQKRFGNEFAPKLFLEQLVYTDDIVDTTIEFVGNPVSKDTIKTFLKNTVKATLDQLL